MFVFFFKKKNPIFILPTMQCDAYSRKGEKSAIATKTPIKGVMQYNLLVMPHLGERGTLTEEAGEGLEPLRRAQYD